MLKEVFYLILSGDHFDKEIMEMTEYPSNEVIEQEIQKANNLSKEVTNARVEKRYKIVQKGE